MITVRPEDAIHKAYLIRLLIEIVDTPTMSQNLYFKGGTCASMMGILDRFSVDLDFDLKKGADEKELRTVFHSIFSKLGFTIKQESQKALEFFVKYPNKEHERNTIKVDALNLFVTSNKYAPCFLSEIDRTLICQTKETMFANKLVAIHDRYQRNGSIAGRDVYDIHHFFILGLTYDSHVIKERTGKSVESYLVDLEKFINETITPTIIDQDLNTLLPNDVFQKIRKTLKQETLVFIQSEIEKIKNNHPASSGL